MYYEDTRLTLYHSQAGDERVRAAMAESQRLETETARAHEEAKKRAEHAKKGTCLCL